MKKCYFLLTILLISLFIFTSCNSSKCENGHTWDEGRITTEATCINTGEILYTCTVCKKTKSAMIAKKDHEISTKWTVTSETHYHLCDLCGEYKEDEAKHTYDETGVCVCGKEIEGFKVSFILDDNVTVYLYDTQDVSTSGVKYEEGMTIFARTSDGVISTSTDEQVNFRVEVSQGYIIDTVEATSDAYKNIKNITDGVYRITKINQDIVITIKTRLEKKIVSKPTDENNTLAYTNSLLVFIPNNFDEKTMEIKNNEAIEVGNYEAIISLKDKENYCWSDLTTDDFVIPYYIVSEKVEVKVPTSSEIIYVYNGDVQYYIPDGFNAGIMNIENNEQSLSGSYEVKVTLKDSDNYYFTNNEEEITFTFTINKCKLTKPTESIGEYYYTSETITYLPSGFMEGVMDIEGNEEINAGSYIAVISLKDTTNYMWDDLSTSNISINYQILPKRIEKPLDNNNTCTYTGTIITYIPSRYNEESMAITNNKQTNVGTYEIVISLIDKNNYVWSDLTTDDLKLSFSIVEKALPYQITSVEEGLIKIIFVKDDITYSATISYPTVCTYDLNQDTGLLKFIYEESTTNLLTFSFSGSYYGGICFDINEEVEVEIEFQNISITSYLDCPLLVQNASEVAISAKKGTNNYIYDYRDSAENYASAIYSACDLKLKGTGALEVYSDNLKGIHSKDDLKIQKLTLSVNVCDNALKGNDGVEILSGNLTLIARTGDGIKTSNTSLSKKGKQKGNVVISDGKVIIYAACDGIDAGCDVVINGGEVIINTDSYSPYSEEVTKISDEIYYLKTTTLSYQYAVYYYNTTNQGEWVIPTKYETVFAGRNNYYYYEVAKLTDYAYLKVYMYSSNQTPGQSESYYKASSELTLNNSYDTIEISQSRYNSSTTFNWTKKTSGNQGGMFPNEGNTDKGTYSTKGIKAGNEITITNGLITINAYDDAIHANNDETLESGVTPTGDVKITGGTLVLTTHDDAIHADGTVNITNGTIKILSCYEGIEGNNVVIDGGDIFITSSDDGINGTNTTNTSIIINGGEIYICAGGDGIDSNTQTSYKGIIFNGGKMVIISTGMSDSSIDTEKGYTYNGGVIIGISRSGGMSNESTKCSNFSSIGTSKNISLTKEQYLVISDIATIKMPSSINALVVVLSDNSLSITSSSSCTDILNDYGVCFKK